MEGNPKVVILYRIAEKKNKNKNKVKPDWVNNEDCFNSLLYSLPAQYDKNGKFNLTDKNIELHVFGDRLKEETVDHVTRRSIVQYHETKAHGNSETFLEVLQFATENLDPNDIVYFVEDDYIHRHGFIDIIREGLEKRADYVSLYDHPDKYGQQTMLFHTKSTHWQFVVSTTMTFATKVKTLVFDKKMFEQAITTGNPPDHHIFSYLTTQMQRRLATPIPGYATHGETQWLAPIINWEEHAR